MKYRFEVLKPEHKSLVEELVTFTKLDYPIDEDCKFIGAWNGNTKLLGIIGFNIKKRYPQFQHIILRESTPRTIGIKLISLMEKFLKDKGYKEVVCYIENIRNDIQVMAMKINYKPYANDTEGVWFYKRII